MNYRANEVSVRRAAPQTSRARICRLSAVAALGLIALVGCGEAPPEHVATFPVQGQLTYKGQPAVGAIVALHPKGQTTPNPAVPSPRANVDKDGRFTVTTFTSGDGAPDGEYVVTVLWYKLIGKGFDVKAGPNVIPAKYTKPQTSDIVVKVAGAPVTVPPIQL